MEKGLFEEFNTLDYSDWKIINFSANNLFTSEARRELEEKYFPLIEVTDDFNRQSVSFQLSKNEAIHRWLKYKEGFSAELVIKLLKEFSCKKGDLILDPFMGSGTTALVALINDMNSIGYDILPISKISLLAKSSAYKYDLSEIEKMINLIANTAVPADYTKKTKEISTTSDAYPDNNGVEIEYFTELIRESELSHLTKNLFTLCALNSLEKVSYSAKDGQYLRWDYRCPKMIAAEKSRLAAGKKPFAVRLDKGDIPPFKEVVLDELKKVTGDIRCIKKHSNTSFNTKCDIVEGSALFNLPLLPDNTIGGVVSSPPYCNRYDYTRTYALELAYLGKNDEEVKQLRQELLSCTVENKSKRERIKHFYEKINRLSDFKKVEEVIANCSALTETIEALKARHLIGEINNKGVLKMVEGYFYELSFIFFEIFRASKSGAGVAFVNDNVRYAGEVVQVDFITCALAEAIGFRIKKIYALKQKKGNSSQQMKKYGKVALRKSITVWEKP